MRTLFLRELRRLAPYGGGLFLGVLLPYALPLPWHEKPSLWSMVILSGVVLALAVSTVVPDTASGGLAFLLRMPVRRGRVIALKTLAAALWTLPVLVTFLLAIGPVSVDPFLGLGLGAIALIFGCGLLASVTSRQVLPAFMVAPLLALAAMLAGLFPSVFALDVYPMPLASVVLSALGVASVIAAAVAFVRGEPHRPSPRPALLAAAVLAPVFVASFAATAAAQAWTFARVLPHELRVVDSVRASGARQLVRLEASLWTGIEQRVAVVEGEGAWLLPVRGEVELEASPDGRWALLRRPRRPGGWLVDLTTRTTTALPGRAAEGFGFPHVVWPRTHGAALPVMLRQVRPGELELFAPYPVSSPEELRRGPSFTFPVPADARLVGVTAGGDALLADDRGLLACELPRPKQGVGGGTRRLPWPEGLRPDDLQTSPRRERVIVRSNDAVHVVDLATGTSARLERPAASAAWRPRVDRPRDVAFSPDEARVVVALPAWDRACFDARTGACLAWFDAPPLVQPAPAWTAFGAAAWAGDGSAVAMPWGPVAWFGPHAGCERAGTHEHGAPAGRRVAAFGAGSSHGFEGGARLALAPLLEPGAPATFVTLELGGAR